MPDRARILTLDDLVTLAEVSAAVHEAGWFRDQDAAAAMLIAPLLVPPLLAN